MDWILLVLVLVEAPNFTNSHTHQFVNFTSEQLCLDASKAYESKLGVPSAGGAKVTVRAVCSQRKR